MIRGLFRFAVFSIAVTSIVCVLVAAQRSRAPRVVPDEPVYSEPSPYSTDTNGYG